MIKTIRVQKVKYYDYEEKYGRQRKNRNEIEESGNVEDLQLHLMEKLNLEGRLHELRAIYSFYLRFGYNYFPVNNSNNNKRVNHRREYGEEEIQE
jgi:hypothetical protein